jgi:hypothetical protein
MLQAAAISKKEEGNRGGHRKVELKTAVTSGKRKIDLQDPQDSPRAGIHEASKRVAQAVTKNDGPDIVEGSNSSETEKNCR